VDQRPLAGLKAATPPAGKRDAVVSVLLAQLGQIGLPPEAAGGIVLLPR
jgi:hypothetical protein